VVDFEQSGKVAYVNLNTMTLELMYQGTGVFSYPHGSAISSDGNTLYVTGQQGDIIYKCDVTDPMSPDIQEIIINNSGGNAANPHEVVFSPDGTKYFLTCSGRNEVRVFDVATDTLVAVIPTASYPLEFAISTATGKLFVTCETGDAVTVIDYTNLTAIKNITVGFQPHGLSVDENKNQVYVANRNTPSSGGPPPHHTSSCGGRNGYLTIIDMATLELVPGFKHELSVDPYSVAVRN
jgi:YVTN family beta-propeller protein